MIFFGSQEEAFLYHTGTVSPCPRCSTTIVQFIEKKKRATVYFAPVGEGNSRYFIVCVHCQNSCEWDEHTFYTRLHSLIGETASPNNSNTALPPQPMPLSIPQHIPPPPNNPPTKEQIDEKIRKIVAETSSKYKRTGWLIVNEVAFIDKTFPYCPFCVTVSNWSCDNSDGFKYRFRCDTCLGEFYGVPHIKKPAKNKFRVNSIGYYNRSSLVVNNIYTLDEIFAAACTDKKDDKDKNEEIVTEYNKEEKSP